MVTARRGSPCRGGEPGHDRTFLTDRPDHRYQHPAPPADFRDVTLVSALTSKGITWTAGPARRLRGQPAAGSSALPVIEIAVRGIDGPADGAVQGEN